jgi:hypothetical protein
MLDLFNVWNTSDTCGQVANQGDVTHNALFKDVIFTKHIVYDLAAIVVDDEDFPLPQLGSELGGS